MHLLKWPIGEYSWVLTTSQFQILRDSYCLWVILYALTLQSSWISGWIWSSFPAHFMLSVNLLSNNIIFSLLLSHRIRGLRTQHHYRLKYIPHLWTCCMQELRDDVPDKNGISEWKRLTNSLNVITPGVDLILWALVLLSHWSVRASHLSVWCQICLKLSQLCRQNESHYYRCISLWKEKMDLFTKQQDMLLLSCNAYY